MDGEQPIVDVPKSAYDKVISTAEADEKAASQLLTAN